MNKAIIVLSIIFALVCGMILLGKSLDTGDSQEQLGRKKLPAECLQEKVGNVVVVDAKYENGVFTATHEDGTICEVTYEGNNCIVDCK